MTGFTLAAVASIAVGLSVGAVATVGVTLAADDMAPAHGPPAPSVAHLVGYGDRCWHGHCIPWP
jgi:hypothetical protein